MNKVKKFTGPAPSPVSSVDSKPLEKSVHKSLVVTSETTIRTILDAHPKAIAIFSERGMRKEFLTDKSTLGTEMEICKRMGPDTVLRELLSDLQLYIEKAAS